MPIENIYLTIKYSCIEPHTSAEYQKRRKFDSIAYYNSKFYLTNSKILIEINSRIKNQTFALFNEMEPGPLR